MSCYKGHEDWRDDCQYCRTGQKPILHPMSRVSDRVTLTVRIASDGNREWLDASGKIALIYFERGCWWARESDRLPGFSFTSEKDALDALLFERLVEIRKEAEETAHILYMLEG